MKSLAPLEKGKARRNGLHLDRRCHNAYRNSQCCGRRTRQAMAVRNRHASLVASASNVALDRIRGSTGSHGNHRLRAKPKAGHRAALQCRLWCRLFVGASAILFSLCTSAAEPRALSSQSLEVGGLCVAFFACPPAELRSPGLRGQQPPRARRTLNDEDDTLHRALRRLDISGPMVLVGHSYGAFLVQIYAHRSPDETKGVVLIDPN
jgi:pimeloyl-ACP methyl ester carboxylesterase